MRDLFAAIVVGSFVLGVPLAHYAGAAKPPEEGEKPVKVLVCHIAERDETTGEVLAAHVIEVSENAVPAHQKHGDIVLPADTTYQKGDDCTAEFHEEEPPAQ